MLRSSTGMSSLNAGGVDVFRKFVFIFIMLFAGSATLLFGPAGALAEQTREECNKCCEERGQDEYYTEQCKLKCFRDHDFCKQEEVFKPEPKDPPKPKPKRPARPAPRGFNLPDQLTLTPGKEWEAAAKILSANGIGLNHPNRTRALKGLEAVLIEFVRNNPQGGRLPAEPVRRVLRAFK